MFGQSFLARLAVTKALNMLGVSEDVAKCAGWVVGIGTMVLTLDATGAGAEVATAAAAEAATNIGVDTGVEAATHVVADITVSATAEASAVAVSESAASLAADHADLLHGTLDHATSAITDHTHSLIPDTVDSGSAGLEVDAPDVDASGDHNHGASNHESLLTRLGRSKSARMAELSVSTYGLGQDLAKMRTTEQANPQPIAILFLASDPVNAKRLRLGEESREIREKLQLGKYRDRFSFSERNSIRPADISQALLDVSPEVVHFSGHGTPDGALCCEDAKGQMQFIQPADLATLFEQFATKVRGVILSSCFSRMQAKAIVKHIQYVVGMDSAIGDRAAIAFAIGFYQALAAGRTIPEAYKLGCAQIGLQGIAGKEAPILMERS
jgi:hypothetical protein